MEDNPGTSGEYFTLLSKLLNFAYTVNAPYSTAEKLLANEIQWLKRAKDLVKTTGNSEAVPGCLLEGHLLITRELLLFLSPTKKHQVGCHCTGPCLVKVKLFAQSNLASNSLRMHDFFVAKRGGCQYSLANNSTDTIFKSSSYGWHMNLFTFF